MTTAKDQHFLPQFYLRQFVDPDTPAGQEPYVWVFKLPERRWQRRAPKNVASLRYYYAYKDKNSQLINDIEPHLSTVESLGATFIRKLEAREALTEQEQLRFSFFVALLTVRTPQNRTLTQRYLKRQGGYVVTAMIQHWRDHPEEFESAKRKYQEKTGATLDFNIDDLEQYRPNLVPSDSSVIGYSLLPAMGLAERLMGMTWWFYFTQAEDRLIICDHPGDFALPEEITEQSFRGFFTKDAEFHVPLTPNLIFAAHDDGFGRGFGDLLSREQVARLNRRMAQRAELFVVSPKPTFLGDEILQTKSTGA